LSHGCILILRFYKRENLLFISILFKIKRGA